MSTETAHVEVSMPDGSTVMAPLLPISEGDVFAAMLGETHWPVVDGHHVYQSASGEWSARPSAYVEVYCDYHTPTIRFARQGAAWYTFPAISDGWAKRSPWSPSAALAERISDIKNLVTFFGVPHLAEDVYGIPRDYVVTATPETYEVLLRGDPA